MEEKLKHIVNHAQESEKCIEKHLCKRIKELGGLCLKVNNPWMSGLPDRLCIIPWNRIFFVELKSKGKKLSPEQIWRCNQLDSMGVVIHVCDSRDKVDDMLRKFGYEV